MELLEAMESRHAVRAYDPRPLAEDVKAALLALTERCNAEGGLHIQLVTGEPEAFGGMMARYGKFSGVTNYLALIGPKGPDLEEKCGYYGEKLVLEAQRLGLNSCWVAMTYSKVKTAFTVDEGEKLCLVVSLGYGKTQGVPHKSKTPQAVAAGYDGAPAWFQKGVDAALLAPTAMNQQKFQLALDGNTVSVRPGVGFYTKLDMGIVKYHFELGAGKDNFTWA